VTINSLTVAGDADEENIRRWPRLSRRSPRNNAYYFRHVKPTMTTTMVTMMMMSGCCVRMSRQTTWTSSLLTLWQMPWMSFKEVS